MTKERLIPLIVATGSVNELDIALYGAGLCHGVLSVVNIAAVSDRVNCDGIGFDREQDAPVARPQPHARRALKRLYIADPGFRERL